MCSGTAQVSHQVCQFFFFVSFVECLEMIPSWCRQVNWGNCGIPWLNCAVLCVKDDWKEHFSGLRYCLSKLRILLSFPSGMASHSKIAQSNWECIAPFRECTLLVCLSYYSVYTDIRYVVVGNGKSVRIACELCQEVQEITCIVSLKMQ